ncbi:MAG: phosphate starvation-inducible protein PhoH [Cycloclasticus sp. symbiont of Bathymodiolus heckerae]|nr:MAG: phosphate starvation-inducible protein PhoH [Cycloclasticus sp. symbiont of Bathymodiolus heckerae]
MNKHLKNTDIRLEPENNKRLASLCGQFNEHLIQLEQRLNVDIKNRGNHFSVSGAEVDVDTAVAALEEMYRSTEIDQLTPAKVHIHMQETQMDKSQPSDGVDVPVIHTRKKIIKPRGGNQQSYVNSISKNDVIFGIGPAGTGKTYLAVACAVEALESEKVARIILARPAVEAGERLGFLPGDLSEKINPYLRPLYDALYEMLGVERVEKLIERNVIEIAPLAFMRGRTLSDAFIILDEAQNTTPEQIKMFLTRIGYGSTVVVTGDITQIDLPKHTESGLKLVMKILKDIPNISFTQFASSDVVRHPIVQKIVSAYEKHQQE